MRSKTSERERDHFLIDISEIQASHLFENGFEDRQRVLGLRRPGAGRGGAAHPGGHRDRGELRQHADGQVCRQHSEDGQSLRNEINL